MSTAAELPTGTVTFLFTDIERSTQLLRELRDDYGTALAEHARIIRAALEAHGGWEIDTQGDAFFTAFRRAKDAVGAAVEAQRELAAHEWPQGKQLRVRMGMHTGEPAVGGERYVGMGVHRAARISAVGHGGQVLVSQTTRELLRDDPLPDVSLRDLGEHQLKDMDEPERIYQLAAPGLETEFPPLKTQAPSAIEGREGEVVEAARGAVREMAARWRRKRVLAGAGVAAALLAVLLAVLLTRGSATASRNVAPNALGVVDSGSGKVSAEISVGHAPSAVASGGGAIWVANGDDNSVSRVDPATNDVRQTIDVGGGPSGLAVGNGSVWVANGLDGTVSRISIDAERVVQTIVVGNGPVGVAFGAGSLWVANAVEGTVSRLDADSGRVADTIPAAPGVTGIAVGFRRVWVAAPPSSTLLVLDPQSGDVVDRIGVGGYPSAVAVGAGAVWVVNRADGTLSRVDPDTGSVSATIAVGRAPSSVAVGGGSVWVANSGNGTIVKVDPRHVRVVKAISVSNVPQALDVMREGVYVAVRSTGNAHRGGRLRAVTFDGIDFIDPALSYSIEGWSILALTNDGLVAFRRVGGIQGTELVPDLAASLPVATDGGKAYTFRLRPGVRYSDGRPVQPEDFRRALERVFEVKPKSAGAPYYGAIAGTDRCRPGRRCDLSKGIVTDRRARTVTFHLRAPDPDFLTKLALTFAVAVPASTPARNVGSHPVPATGPYMVASTGKKETKLVRNPRFHIWSTDAKPDGYPDTITWSQLNDPAKVKEAVNAVVRGAQDIAVTVVPPLQKRDLETLATRYPGQLHMTTSPTTLYYFLNTRIPPFDDLRARRAVNYALDRKAFAALAGRAAAPTCQIFPPNYPSFRKTCPFGAGGVAGLDKARRLVRASGTAGQLVVIWTLKPQLAGARFMAALLRSLGYRTRLRVFPGPDQYFARAYDPRSRAQMGFAAWASDFPSEGGFMPPLFSCDAIGATNASQFCDRAIDREFAHASSVQAQDPPAAHALWRRIEQQLLSRAVVVPTNNSKFVAFMSKRVGNYQYHPQWGPLLDQLWVR